MHFRACGRGARECTVFWAAPREVGGHLVRVAAVIHPRHKSTVASTEMDMAEICALNELLYRRQMRVVVQVHTHPGAAFHSSTDDEFALVATPGFVSIVVPQFCRHGLLRFPDCYVTEFDGRDWRALSQREREERLLWEAS